MCNGIFIHILPNVISSEREYELNFYIHIIFFIHTWMEIKKKKKIVMICEVSVLPWWSPVEMGGGVRTQNLSYKTLFKKC